MNRLDYALLLEEVEKELAMPGGNFEALYGGDPKALEQARYVAAVALVAADRLYSGSQNKNSSCGKRMNTFDPGATQTR